MCEQNKGKARSRTGTLEASLEASQKKKSKKGSGFSNSIQKKQEGKKKGGGGGQQGVGWIPDRTGPKKDWGGVPRDPTYRGATQRRIIKCQRTLILSNIVVTKSNMHYMVPTTHFQSGM